MRHADEQVLEVGDAVFADQGVRLALQQDAAPGQEHHPVADLGHLVHVVAGPQHAAAVGLGGGDDMGADVPGGGRVDRGGGLVQQQQLGVVEHGLGQGHAGLFAGRQQPALGHAVVHQVVLGQELVDPRLQVLHAVDQAEHLEVLLHRQVAGQGGVGGGEVGVGQGLGPVGGEVDAVDMHLPRRGLQHAHDHADGGGLARAVGPDQADDLAGGHLERDAIHRDQAVVDLLEAGDGQDGGEGGGHRPLDKGAGVKRPSA